MLTAALALGRFTLMPCTDAVVMMMKITSNTYARSSMGVMLMSSYGLSSSCARMIRSSGRDGRRVGGALLFRQASHELVDEHLHVRGDVLVADQQVVVAKQRGDRDEQTGHGGEQRSGDTGCDGVDVHVAGRRDRREGDHDADHGAEQAEEGPTGNGDGEQDHRLRQLLVLAHQYRIHGGADRFDGFRSDVV